MARLVLLSGPSCVGKGPLVSALERHYPELAAQLVPLVLHNSRAPRPGEIDGVDYYFRPRAEIERIVSSRGFVAGDVRGDYQGLELATIDQALEAGRDAFFEGNPFIPEMLREAGVLDQYPTLTVFLSPLGRDEIIYLQDPARRVDLGSFVADVMRRKLLRRTTRQKTHLSQVDLEDIERRASSAIVELRHAHKYDHVIPNHDGEDSENWDAFYYPVGDAFVTLASFAALLAGESSDRAETWEAGLLRPTD
ncbi:MAG: guanylate kinase [Acidimicrobiia bacterium]|nr:MAG: guanylate kinase [Acidimicrobiia bacterium]